MLPARTVGREPTVTHDEPELPGNEMLIGWEARLRAGQHGSNLPMFELIFGVDHPDAKTETEQAQPENAEEGGS